MRNSFLHYYTPTKDEFASLWRHAIFSFDASVLLDLYRYTQASREELLRLFKQHQDRIWLTHQAGLEFSRNRFTVIAEANKKAADLRKQIDNLKAIASDRYQQHPFVSAEVCRRIVDACETFSSELQEAEDAYPNYLMEDPILTELLDLFTDKVGNPFTEEELKTKSVLIDARYAADVPPGFADLKNKDAPRSYGDCVLWFQLMEFAKTNGKPVIFVTRDLKEDWWLREGGRTLLPHPELRREFKIVTGQDFYLYQAPRFIEEAKTHRKNTVSAALVAEARAMSEESLLRRERLRETATAIQERLKDPKVFQGAEVQSARSNDALRALLERYLTRADSPSKRDDDDDTDQSGQVS